MGGLYLEACILGRPVSGGLFLGYTGGLFLGYTGGLLLGRPVSMGGLYLGCLKACI